MDRILERLQKLQRESKVTMWVIKYFSKPKGNVSVDATIFDKNKENPKIFSFFSFHSEQKNEETFKELEDYLHDCEAQI